MGELVAHLVGSPEAAALAGAELVSGAGWFGLRSHPHPVASVTFGGPDLRTVYIGSLKGSRIPFFRSPVAGLPMVHWNERHPVDRVGQSF